MVWRSSLDARLSTASSRLRPAPCGGPRARVRPCQSDGRGCREGGACMRFVGPGKHTGRRSIESLAVGRRSGRVEFFPRSGAVEGLTGAEAAGQLPALFSLTPCNRPIARIRRNAPARLASAPATPPAVAAKCSPLVAPRAASVSPLSEAPQGCLRFRAAQRVLRSADFSAAREAGRRIDGGWFLLWVRTRGDDRPARLGVAASRAVGGAVVRNRAKRLVRDIFRRHQHEIPPGLDLIVSARRALPNVDVADLEKRFLKTLRRIAGEPTVQP